MLRLGVLASLVGNAYASRSTEGERPIAKVIKLLRDMQKQMEAEKEDDDAVHKKYQCWCTKEEEEKSAIAEKQSAEMKKQDSAAKAAFSESEKKAAKRVKVYEQFTTKQQELEQLRNKCMSEKGEFSAKDQELEKSIIATKNAITILSKHNFLQSGAKASEEVKNALAKVAASKTLQDRADAGDNMQGFLAIEAVANGEDLSKSSPSFLQQSPGFGSYGNQSGQIFGILNQMLEDLTRDQSEAAKEEKARIQACSEGDAALAKEIGLLETTLAGLDARLGELAATEAAAKEDYVAAKESYGNAVEFLGKMKTQCEASAGDYESRTKSRDEELVAIADTINILDNDDSFKAFGSALGTSDPSKAVPEEELLQGASSFLQLASNTKKNDVINGELRRSAVEALQKFSTKSAKLFFVQYLIKTAAVDKGAIKKVQEKIDVLIGEMKAQQTEEIALRDECNADLNTVKMDMEEKSRDKANTEEELAALEEELSTLASSLEELTADTEKLKTEAAEATESRKKETAEYQVVVKDHQAVQEILQKAIDRMNMVYSDMKVQYALAQQQPGADFVAVENTDTTPGSGPAAFTKEGSTVQNAGGNKVVTMLKEVMADSAKTEKDATTAENDAQSAYESFMAETDRAVAKNEKAFAQKTKRSGESEGLKGDAEETISSLSKGLFDLTEENTAIHGRCDFLLNNFDGRQTARTNEMQALAQAKQLLGGMS